MKKQILVLGCLICLMGLITPAWAIYCPQCGVEVADDARFCRMCGKPLTGKIEVATSSTQVSEAPGSNVLAAPPSPQAFQVNSRYLLVNGFRISRKSLFWVAEVSGDRARVWCVNESLNFGIVMGWVSVAELEKRTTLKLDAGIQCVEPPPPSAEIVVIKSRPYWRKWYPRPFYWSHHHRDSHHWHH